MIGVINMRKYNQAVLLVLFTAILSLSNTLFGADTNYQRKFLGDKNAKTTIYEFVSLSCIHCARFNNEVLPKIKTNYVDNGLVKIIFIDVPLGSEVNMFAHSLLYKTKNTSSFFNLASVIFKQQNKWVGASDGKKIIESYARLAGLSNDDILSASADMKLQNWLKSDAMALLNELNIQGTPTLIIAKSSSPIGDSKNIKLEGYKSYEEVKVAIDGIK